MLLMCPQCQAQAQSKCDCGVGYVPAHDLARREVIRAPHKSDRAIAKQLGVGVMTVSRARSSVPNGTVERRQGRDGKLRRMPVYKVPAGRKGPGISVPRDEKFPGFYRLQTAWYMATSQETEMFLKWVREQQERKPCNVVSLKGSAA